MKSVLFIPFCSIFGVMFILYEGFFMQVVFTLKADVAFRLYFG